SAQKKGNEVTLFNRGKHNPDWFPNVEKLKGDRDGDFESLKGRTFDAVIDTSGYVPRIVKLSAEFLKDKTDNYTFISSISVYKDFSEMGMNENSVAATIEYETTEEITGDSYGPLKYLCEKAVEEIYKERALIIRPGLIVGEEDPSDRFGYWIYRINKGGKVLAPGPKEKNVQYIDVKDLADWSIKMIEEKNSGTYSATGPDYNLTFEKLIDDCKKVSGSNAEIIWIDQKFLMNENAGAYVELPLWLPDEMDGGNNCDVSKAIGKGLTFRLLEETLKDSMEFINSKKDYTLKAGLKTERETELIKKWESENQ
ncbi:MAG: NAD-dependent epimerase/dehydratase family protein, partial [Ignavibacteria bacterium]|nr:NAD-dependent epimerase/dehydratase family protein [Ignavibacteria bacterium]